MIILKEKTKLIENQLDFISLFGLSDRQELVKGRFEVNFTSKTNLSTSVIAHKLEFMMIDRNRLTISGGGAGINIGLKDIISYKVWKNTPKKAQVEVFTKMGEYMIFQRG